MMDSTKFTLKMHLPVLVLMRKKREKEDKSKIGKKNRKDIKKKQRGSQLTVHGPVLPSFGFMVMHELSFKFLRTFESDFK